MLINPALFVFLVASIILLSIVLVSIVIAYVSTIKRLSFLEREKDQMYKLTSEEQHKILSTAQEKANEILKEATMIKGETEAKLAQDLASLSQDVIKAYQAQAQQLNQDTINSYNNISKQVVDYMQTHLEDLKKNLVQQTVDSQKMVEAKFKEEYTKLDGQLALYKKTQLEKIDQNIYAILLNVSRIAFGRGIPIEKHEDLITEALEQAMRDVYKG